MARPYSMWTPVCFSDFDQYLDLFIGQWDTGVCHQSQQTDCPGLGSKILTSTCGIVESKLLGHYKFPSSLSKHHWDFYVSIFCLLQIGEVHLASLPISQNLSVYRPKIMWYLRESLAVQGAVDSHCLACGHISHKSQVSSNCGLELCDPLW
jgi:hypothetical protein